MGLNECRVLRMGEIGAKIWAALGQACQVKDDALHTSVGMTPEAWPWACQIKIEGAGRRCFEVEFPAFMHGRYGGFQLHEVQPDGRRSDDNTALAGASSELGPHQQPDGRCAPWTRCQMQ